MITAVGLVNNVLVMATAIIAAVLVMMLASDPVGNFIDKHPTVKMLALAFIILAGVALIADGLEFHIPRGYLYFGMALGRRRSIEPDRQESAPEEDRSTRTAGRRPMTTTNEDTAPDSGAELPGLVFLKRGEDARLRQDIRGCSRTRSTSSVSRRSANSRRVNRLRSSMPPSACSGSATSIRMR